MNIKILIISIVGMIVLSAVAFAFSFNWDILGYTISYNPPPDVEVINNVVPAQEQQQVNQVANIVDEKQYDAVVQIHDYDEQIKQANNIKELQFILKEMDYRRIGLINTDDGQEYTIYISQEGLIKAAAKGPDNPGAVITGSLKQITADIQNKNYLSLKDDIKIPFKVKMKLMWKWF